MYIGDGTTNVGVVLKCGGAAMQQPRMVDPFSSPLESTWVVLAMSVAGVEFAVVELGQQVVKTSGYV